jgi:hypothetical protein
MLKPVFNLPQGIVGVRAEDHLTSHDFEAVVEPLVENMRKKGFPVRLLIEIGPNFRGIVGARPWRELKEGFTALHLLDKIALVASDPAIRAAARLAAALVACDVRTYAKPEAAAATEWLMAPRTVDEEAPSIRILPDEQALLIELRGRFSEEDFDSITRVATTWTGAGGELCSLVLHGERFPGWEDPSSVVKRWQFIQNHLHDLRRIAIATGGPFGAFFASAGDEYTDAEIRRFHPARLYEAIEWAGEASTECLRLATVSAPFGA